MLYNLILDFVDQYSFLNVFKYLTFRTGLSVGTSLAIVFLIGGPLIKIFSKNRYQNDLIFRNWQMNHQSSSNRSHRNSKRNFV